MRVTNELQMGMSVILMFNLKCIVNQNCCETYCIYVGAFKADSQGTDSDTRNICNRFLALEHPNFRVFTHAKYA